MEYFNSYKLKMLYIRAKRRLAVANNHEGFVNILDGRCSFGEKLYTNGLTGCIAVLLYFEFENNKRGGILTHYPPLLTLAHIQKLWELEVHITKENLRDKKGVILARRPAREASELEKAIKHMFAKIDLETIAYEPPLIGEVHLYPSQSSWTSAQFGTRYFR